MAQPLRKVLSNAWQKPGPMLRYVSDGVADTEHAMGDGSSGTGETWYDQQGNLLTQKTAGGNQETFTWNNRNLLTQVVTKNSSGTVTQTVNYTYNAANQRISKIVTNGSGVVVTNQRYIYDGNNLLAVLNVDPTTGTPTVAQRFMTQESGVGSQETGVLAQENAGSNSSAGPVLWSITDNTGSVVDVVANGSGNAILDHIVYDSFGNTVSQTNSADAMLMGFDGYVYDAETGLYYANARYYSPTLGRFISQDPSGFTAGDSNLYRFVGNHPTYSVDPTGLYEGGSSFTQGTSSYGGSSLIAPWLNLGSGSSGSASTGSSPVSLTNTTSAFGGNGPISAPTSTGASSGLLGSGNYGSGNNSIAFNLGNGPMSTPTPAAIPTPTTAAGIKEQQRTALFLGQLGYQDIQDAAFGLNGPTGANPISDLAAVENAYGSAGLGNVNLPVPQDAWLPSANNTLVPVAGTSGLQTAVQIAAANDYQQQSLINQGGVNQAYPEQYFIPGPGPVIGDMVIEDAGRTIGGTLLGETGARVAQTGVVNITAHDIANELSSANHITAPMAGQPGNSILDWNLQQAGAGSTAANYENLVARAQEAYPNKAGTQFHHITPQYLANEIDGPTVEIPAAYHQQITNAFRQEYPYGTGTIPSPARLQQIMNKVYSQYPLPPGTKW